MGESLDIIKQDIRSVLLSSKAGVKASRLQGEYQELCGGYIPHTKFGYSTLQDFLASLNDVVRIGRNSENELTYYAIADKSTKHIQSLVSKQKPKKQPKKKAPPSSSRNVTFSKPFVKPKFSKISTGYSKPNYKKKHHLEHPKKPQQTSYKKTFSLENSSRLNDIKKIEHSSDRQNSFQQKINKQNFSNKSHPDSKNIKGVDDSRKNQIPPRFSRKIIKNDTRECSLYDNPLGSSPAKSKNSDFANKNFVVSEKHSICSQDAIIQQDEFEDNFEMESGHERVISNLKKLLSISKGGLHLAGISSLYKKTYQEELLDSVLDDIVNGVIKGCASVEKVHVNGNNKYILFPYSESLFRDKNISISVDVKFHSILNLGEDYEVIVTYSATCEKIYVQLLSEHKMLQEMVTKIKQAYISLSELHSIKTGSFVITQDYFRAKVISIKKKQVELYKIDFADCTASYWTSLKNLRPMSPSIAEFPRFCILCTLHRPSNDMSQKWTMNSAEEFTETYAHDSLILTTIGISLVKFNEIMEPQNLHNVIFYKGNQQYKSNVNARLLDEEKAAQVVINNCSNPFEFQPNSFAELPNKEICNLFVFNVSCTTEVEVCIIGSGFSDKLDDLENKMFEFYNNAEVKTKLPSPPPCNCIYAVLSEENCTRCRLISIENDYEGTVYLVDNGETETILLKNLRSLTNEFIHLPMQCINVCLAGLDHNAIATHCTILQKLSDTVVHKTCTARIVEHLNKSSNKTSIVELFTPSETTSTSLNQICFEMITNESLFPMLPASDSFSAVSIGNVDVENSLVFVRLAGEGMVKLNDCLAELESSLDCQACDNIYQDKLCIAKLPDGMYRARVQKLNSDDSQKLSVYLIDIGTIKSVTPDALLKLEDETALSIPPQAICCRLSEAVSNNSSQKALNDIANVLSTSPSLPVLMKVEKFLKDEPHVVSLWLDDECKTQIVGHENYRPHSKLSNYSKSSSSTNSRSNSELSEITVENRSNVDVGECFDNDIFPINKPFTEPTEQNLVLSDIKTIADFMYRNTQAEQYKHVLSLDENPLTVRVEDAVAPDCLQIISMHDVRSRDILCTTLNHRYDKSRRQKEALDIKTNQMYAWYSESENLWYRVRALSMIDNDVSVYLVDYGYCRATVRSFLHALDAQFAKLPDFVITAKLSGIRPLAEHDGVWPDNVSCKVRDYLKGKCYLAHVLKIVRCDPILQRDVWEVLLSDMSAPNFWINDFIVDEWKCASYLA